MKQYESTCLVRLAEAGPWYKIPLHFLLALWELVCDFSVEEVASS